MSEEIEDGPFELSGQVPMLDYGQHQSREIADLIAALAKAQESFTDPKKDTQGQYGLHASMAGVYDSVRKHLNAQGIYVAVYKSADHAASLVGVCVRLHKGEQYIGAYATTPIKADRQSYIWAQASGWTYLERYLLSGLTGVAPDDDDDGAQVANKANPSQKDVRAAAQQRVGQMKAENISKPAGASTANPTTQPSTQRPAASPASSQGRAGQLTFEAPDLLTTVIKGVQELSAEKVAALPKGKNPWVTVTFLGSHSGVSFASCFAAHLWETLKDSVGLECKFRIAERDKDSTHYINIVDILAVDGQPIQLGEGQ
jgi:hypothetical protein